MSKVVCGIILIYALVMVDIINWGIPNLSHPYNYHMDEWHQLQSIRSLFEYGTSNVPGAANGTIFQFLLSGLYIFPFMLLKIVDPFSIKTGVDSLLMQEKLFEILRLNTLIFGILSIFVLTNLVKKYFKVNPIITVILFTVTPLWLALSSYFKYDIALIFWIIVSLFYLLKYGSDLRLKSYIVAGIFCSLAIATKISALPLFIIYIFSFFYFNWKRKKKYRELLIGFLIFLVIFLAVGIPDLLFQKGDYGEYLYSNLIRDKTVFDNFILPYNSHWIYLVKKVIPLDFGYVFAGLTGLSLIYWGRKLNFRKYKNETFLFVSMVVFILGLIPLELGANGNRLLVLLPFFAIFSSLFLFKIFQIFPLLKVKIYTVLIFLFFIQFLQSFTMIYVKLQTDPRELSSHWIAQNISKESVIGIQNIPIYQLLPDLIIKEFYSKQTKNRIFNYKIIDDKTISLPSVIIVTNREFDLNYLRKSEKKSLIARLNKENYKMVKEFKPPQILYKTMGDEFDFYSSGIVPIWTISVYRQDKNLQN